MRRSGNPIKTVLRNNAGVGHTAAPSPGIKQHSKILEHRPKIGVAFATKRVKQDTEKGRTVMGKSTNAKQANDGDKIVERQSAAIGNSKLRSDTLILIKEDPGASLASTQVVTSFQ